VAIRVRQRQQKDSSEFQQERAVLEDKIVQQAKRDNYSPRQIRTTSSSSSMSSATSTAPILFASAIAKDKPIKVFNHGEMWRDFTYIDDIVAGVLMALDRPAKGTPPHALYNLGNNKSEKLTDFIGEIEKAMGKKAEKIMAPMQPGDVPATYADIEASARELGFQPTTPISLGIPKFVAWFKDYYGV